MSLSVFYYCICIFLCHCHSFNPPLCRLSPFLLSLRSLFHGHVACQNVTLTGPLACLGERQMQETFPILVLGFWALFPLDVVNNATLLAYPKCPLISAAPHLSALLVIGPCTSKQKIHPVIPPPPPSYIRPPLYSN